MNSSNNQKAWRKRAAAVLPAGGFGNFDHSIVIRKGCGSRVWDEDGTEYIDYLIGSGPMLLGHGDPEVLDAIQRQLSLGLTFFANNAAGIELAEVIVAAVPCAEQIRYLTSGSEADMYAIRLARAATGRNMILKFEGGYHGMSAEAQMSLAPTKLTDYPRAVPDSAGIPPSVAADMLIAPFNDLAAVRALINQYESKIAAVIVEPLQRIVPPVAGFLQGLRSECDRHGIVLIFDEIVTGFRFAYGGAQEAYGVVPDLCSLGKIIGGGFPLAAVAGKKSIMDHFDKSLVGADRWLMQLGTLSGNPVAAVAGLKTLEILRRPGSYEKLRASGTRLMNALKRELNDTGIAYQVVGHPSLFDVVFVERPVNNYRDVLAADAGLAARFNQSLRAGGIFKSSAKYYPSLALTEADLSQTEDAIHSAVQSLTADAVYTRSFVLGGL